MDTRTPLVEEVKLSLKRKRAVRDRHEPFESAISGLERHIQTFSGMIEEMQTQIRKTNTRIQNIKNSPGYLSPIDNPTEDIMWLKMLLEVYEALGDDGPYVLRVEHWEDIIDFFSKTNDRLAGISDDAHAIFERARAEYRVELDERTFDVVYDSNRYPPSAQPSDFTFSFVDTPGASWDDAALGRDEWPCDSFDGEIETRMLKREYEEECTDAADGMRARIVIKTPVYRFVRRSDDE